MIRVSLSFCSFAYHLSSRIRQCVPLLRCIDLFPLRAARRSRFLPSTNPLGRLDILPSPIYSLSYAQVILDILTIDFLRLVDDFWSESPLSAVILSFFSVPCVATSFFIHFVCICYILVRLIKLPKSPIGFRGWSPRDFPT